MDFAAVGRHHDGDGNEPTVLTFGAGTPIEWYPSWPEAPPAEIRYEAWSSGYTPAPTLDPNWEWYASLEEIDVRNGGFVTITQQPTLANNNTTIVEFNDNAPAGPAWYSVILNVDEVRPVPEPSSLLLVMGSLLAFGAFKFRQRGR